MGYFEFNGFEVYFGYVMEFGMDLFVFKKFKKVFSGYYYMKFIKGNIIYLGNLY